MNAMAIINVVIWSYVALVGLFLFVRFIVLKIKVKREIKKHEKKQVKEVDFTVINPEK